MNKFITYGLLFVALILSGCVMRITPREVDRVDQGLKGNKGVVRGKATGLKVVEKRKTKTIYDVEIELPLSLSERRRDSGPQGNKGYMAKNEIPEQKSRTAKKRKTTAGPQRLAVSDTPRVVFQESTEAGKKYAKEKGSEALRAAEKREKVYIVKKGDTLQKISDKMYGTTKKWKKIYEANKDVLKGPDMIKPGQRLVIPE